MEQSMCCLVLFVRNCWNGEAQIRELVTAVQNVQAQLTASEAARTALQAQVDRMGRASGERKIGVETRNPGRPFQFNGTDSAWRDWSVVFRSYHCGEKIAKLILFHFE